MVRIAIMGSRVITAFIPRDRVSLTSGWRAHRQEWHGGQEFFVSRWSLPSTVILSAAEESQCRLRWLIPLTGRFISCFDWRNCVVSGALISMSFLEDQPSPRRCPIPFPTLLNTTIYENFLGSSCHPHTSCVLIALRLHIPKMILPQIGRYR